MLFKSQIFTQVSGSIGGTTFAHNSAGLYTRARSIPVNPNSAAQQQVRNNLTELAQAWNNVLNEPSRLAWTNYALLSPVTGKFGDPLILSGQQMYIRCNTVRLRAGIARVDLGPVTAGLIMLTPPVGTISIVASTISSAFDNTDQWANEVGGGLLIQTGHVLSPGINFTRGPLRFRDTVVGDPTPETSPVTAGATAFGEPVALMTIGQKVELRYTAFEVDGRISSATSELVTVIA